MRKLCFLGLLLCLLFYRSLPAAIFVVNVTHSQGTGSFRTALTAANALPGRDTIQFAFVGVGPFVIHPDSTTLPINVIADPLLIDGLSQAGTVFPNLQIVIQGSTQNPWIELNSSGLEVQGIHWQTYVGGAFWSPPGSIPSIRDLSFHHNIFEDALGLRLSNEQSRQVNFSNNVLQCQSQLLQVYLETGASMDSVYFRHNTTQCPVSSFYPISLADIQLDYGCTVDGVWVEDNQLDNTSATIPVNGLSFMISTTGSFTDTVRNVYFRHNVFSGQSGIALSFEMQPGNWLDLSHVVIDSNTVDSVTSAFVFRHNGSGVEPSRMRDISITHNHIAHCNGDGIGIYGLIPYRAPRIENMTISDNEIHDNQSDGIVISNNYVSGLLDTNAIFQGIHLLRNHIYNNGKSGIRLSDGDDFLPDFGHYFEDIQFLENSIHDNGWQGIMANGSFPTANLTCRLPVPQLSHISPHAPFTVYGALAAQPNTAYRIEFFANTTPDLSGFGEGEFPLGADTILLDNQGNGLIAWPAGASMPLHVSALATNLSNGNTGCFSNVVDTMTVGILERNMAAPKVWPNPVVGERVYFESHMPIDHVVLYNALGVQMEDLVWEREGNRGVLNCGHLAHGVYLLRMQSGDGSWTQKLMVQ